MKKLFTLTMICFIVASLQAKIYYVTADATTVATTSTISDWNNPVTLASTISIATTATDSIWVKAGTYFVDRSVSTNTCAIRINSGVKKIFGGFAGTETNLSQRSRTDLDGNGIVGDAGDVAIDVSDNVRDNRYQFSPPLYSSPEEANAAVRQLNRQMGSTRVAGQPTQTSAPNTNISSVPATTSVSGEKPVLRGREAQIAMAMKKGKRLQTESLSTIISRMLNG